MKYTITYKADFYRTPKGDQGYASIKDMILDAESAQDAVDHFCNTMHIAQNPIVDVRVNNGFTTGLKQSDSSDVVWTEADLCDKEFVYPIGNEICMEDGDRRQAGNQDEEWSTHGHNK